MTLIRTHRLRIPLLFVLLALWAGPAAAISAEEFFRDYEFINVRLSPDGKKLGALAKLGQPGYNLIVIDLETLQTHQITSLTKDSVRFYRWVNDERLIFYSRNDTGQRTTEFHTVGLDGEYAKPVHHRINTFIRTNEANRDEAFMLRATHSGPEVVAYNTRTGKRRRLAKNPGDAYRYSIDHAGVVRMALTVEGRNDVSTYRLLYRRDAESDWRTLREFENSPLLVPLSWRADNRTVHVLCSEDRKTYGLCEFDPEENEVVEVVHRDDTRDVGGINYSSQLGKIVGVWMADDQSLSVWLDDDARLTAQALGAELPGMALSIQWNDSLSIGLVNTSSPTDPGGYWLYDRKAGKLKHLMNKADWLSAADLVPVRPVSFKARDGQQLHGYLTLPASGDGPFPMILHPHGGPFGVLDRQRFDAFVQFMASRGYAVLQVNFRGSGGYGVEFEASGHKQWGRKMQDDLSDGVTWAVEQGHAESDRVCIYGGSYGGYAALMGAVRTPELYRCAVSFAGVSDLLRLRSSVYRRRSDALHAWMDRTIGDYWEDHELLKSNSPTKLAANTTIPILLLHGKLDGVVHWHHTDAMHRALQDAGKSVEVYYYEKEGHGFHNDKNRVDAHRRIAAFFDRLLMTDN